MQGFEIYVYGKAWNLIYAELYISASYDIFDITNAHFYVRVIVDLRGLTDVSLLHFIFASSPSWRYFDYLGGTYFGLKLLNPAFAYNRKW